MLHGETRPINRIWHLSRRMKQILGSQHWSSLSHTVLLPAESYHRRHISFIGSALDERCVMHDCIRAGNEIALHQRLGSEGQAPQSDMLPPQNVDSRDLINSV